MCLNFCLDRGCIHGVQPDPAVHLIPPGCSEEQQTFRRTTADSPTGDEPHACSTGGHYTETKPMIRAGMFVFPTNSLLCDMGSGC